MILASAKGPCGGPPGSAGGVVVGLQLPKQKPGRSSLRILPLGAGVGVPARPEESLVGTGIARQGHARLPVHTKTLPDNPEADVPSFENEAVSLPIF